MTFISNDCVLYHQTKHINQFLVSIFLIQPLKTLLVELTETRYVGQNLNLMMIPAFHVFLFFGQKTKTEVHAFAKLSSRQNRITPSLIKTVTKGCTSSSNTSAINQPPLLNDIAEEIPKTRRRYKTLRYHWNMPHGIQPLVQDSIPFSLLYYLPNPQTKANRKKNFQNT